VSAGDFFKLTEVKPNDDSTGMEPWRRRRLSTVGSSSTSWICEMKDGQIVLLKDHLFPSPSSAGELLVGGSNNGRTSWKNAAGLDLKHIEASELSAASGLDVQASVDAEP
jgi:hypothetical protein